MINSVRNTVLSILNKNNYGYISPSDFNLYAKQAQMEIFENYFSNYNMQIAKENARMSGTGYADLKQTMEEAMEVFLMPETVLTQVAPSTNEYFLPSLVTTGDEYFMVNKILCYDVQGLVSTFKGEAEKVNHSKITSLLTSNLTSPSETFPAYTQQGLTVKVYPDTFNGANEVKCVYFRYPLDPKWTYVTLLNGEPSFDQSQPDYKDFELPIEEEIRLVTKILQYAGVSIREAEVVQFAKAEEQQQKAQ
jgi:hypothetical protein